MIEVDGWKFTMAPLAAAIHAVHTFSIISQVLLLIFLIDLPCQQETRRKPTTTGRELTNSSHMWSNFRTWSQLHVWSGIQTLDLRSGEVDALAISPPEPLNVSDPITDELSDGSYKAGAPYDSFIYNGKYSYALIDLIKLINFTIIVIHEEKCAWE